MNAKGINSRTGTVHYAKSDGTQLVQTCGIKANQHAYLSPVSDDTEVTCRKCIARTPRAKKVVERKMFGRQEWSMTELRDMAKHFEITGRTSMTGEELLTAVNARNPRVN